MVENLRVKLSSGNLFPLIGFGTYQIRGAELIYNVLDYALGAGYRLIDTASVYRNEEDIGKALKELLPKHKLQRKDVWITSKLSPSDQGPRAYEAVEESLKKLDCEYLDLYLIHWPGSNGVQSCSGTNAQLRNESWKQMTRAVKAGLTRNIGVSNYLVKHLQELLDDCHGIRPACNQIELHPHYYLEELTNFCKDENIFVQAYSSLGGSGNGNLMNDAKVMEIATKLNKSSAQVLLRWAFQHQFGIIPKARSLERIRQNIDLDFWINEHDMEVLDELPQVKYAWDPQVVV